MQRADDALPQFALARLGSAQALKHLVELCQSVGCHAEGIARATDNADEFVIVCLSYVVYARMGTLNEPRTTKSKKTHQVHDIHIQESNQDTKTNQLINR